MELGSRNLARQPCVCDLIQSMLSYSLMQARYSTCLQGLRLVPVAPIWPSCAIIPSLPRDYLQVSMPLT
jgi:hypothetical protein